MLDTENSLETTKAITVICFTSVNIKAAWPFIILSTLSCVHFEICIASKSWTIFFRVKQYYLLLKLSWCNINSIEWFILRFLFFCVYAPFFLEWNTIWWHVLIHLNTWKLCKQCLWLNFSTKLWSPSLNNEQIYKLIIMVKKSLDFWNGIEKFIVFVPVLLVFLLDNLT